MINQTTIETTSKLQNVDIFSQLKESIKKCKSYTVALPIINSRQLLRMLAKYAIELDDPFLNIICAKLGLFDLRKSFIPRYISQQKSKTITQIMTPEEHSRLIQRMDKIQKTDKAAVIITLDFADGIHVNTFGKPQWIDFLIKKLKEGGGE